MTVAEVAELLSLNQQTIRNISTLASFPRSASEAGEYGFDGRISTRLWPAGALIRVANRARIVFGALSSRSRICEPASKRSRAVRLADEPELLDGRPGDTPASFRGLTIVSSHASA